MSQSEKAKTKPGRETARTNGEAKPAEADEVEATAADATAADAAAADDGAVEAEVADDSKEQVGADEREAALEAEIATLKDRLMRALAETENVRRRLQREKEEGVKYAAAGLAKDLLSVTDNLRRALESVDEEALADNEPLKALHGGVELVERELLTVFERQGIRRIEPLGEMFDHDFHEAMFEVPDTDQPAGTVVQLLQPGYVMHDRLLRPALVGVAKGAPDRPEKHQVDTTA